MIPRNASLSISVTRVTLVTGMHAGSSEGHACQTLRFSGVVIPPEKDWQTDIWDLPVSMSGHAVEISCAPRSVKRGKEKPTGPMGWCQISPIAGDLPVHADVACCPKIFQSLKNALAFGGASRTGLMVNLEIAEDEETPYRPGSMIVRLRVTDMTTQVVRDFFAPTCGDGSDIAPVESLEATFSGRDALSF